MANKPSNETVIEQLRHGLAEFELVSSPVLSISSYRSHKTPISFPSYNTHLFFARIGSGVSPAMKKMEHYSVQRITGDGRCLFRALVKGMSFNKGVSLNSREERDNAGSFSVSLG